MNFRELFKKLDRETVRIKLRILYINKTADLRSKKICSKDWTIISNNCWGGFIYQSYGLKYNTPTIGSFFMAQDYIEFISNIKKWIYEPLYFIQAEKSKYYEHFKEWNKFGSYPIGILGSSNNIEIHFLHYHTAEEAENHWNDRVKRINWCKVLYKFNDQNLCTEEHLKRFSELPVKNKICFTTKEYHRPDIIHIKCPRKYLEIQASYEPVGANRRININNIINKL